MSIAINAEVFDFAVLQTNVKWDLEQTLLWVGQLKQVVQNRTVTKSIWTEYVSSRMSMSECLSYWSVFMQTRRSILGRNGDCIDLSTLGIMILCQCYPTARARADSSQRSEALVQSLATTAVSPLSPTVSPAARTMNPRHSLLHLPRILRDNSSILQFVLDNISHYVDMLTLDTSGAGDCDLTEAQVRKLEILLLSPSESGSISDLILRGQASIKPKQLISRLHDLIYWDEAIFPQLDTSISGHSNQLIGSPFRTSLVITNQTRKTFLRDDATSECIQSLSFINCTESTLFIAGLIGNAAIIGCTDCEIVLMATTGTLLVSHCDKVTVRSIANSIRLENSTDCTAYVYTPRGIILAGDTRGIQLAPFNVTFSEHTTVLAKAGIHPDSSHATTWSQPLCSTLSDSPYVLVSPERFRLISFPENNNSELATCLPQLYSDSVSRKIRSFEGMRSEILSLTDETSASKINAIISGHFREWISSNNKSRGLIELLRLGTNQ
jgi:hypothetical protein